MIIVTGTKRSGTSMWMQILIGAGFPGIGTAFPGIWEQSIRDANPRGFFESKFRQGIYFATNPDPETGAFLRPDQVARHVVKVFIPGLVRTDFAYITRVIASMRHWREYQASLTRLYAMEDGFRDAQRSFPPERLEAMIRAGRLPPALEWWFENYDLIRNVVTRRFPFHMTTYDRLLADPEGEIGKVLRWLGEGDAGAAVRAVEPALRTQSDRSATDPLVADFAEVFDELYHAVDRAGALDAAFIDKLNITNEALTERWDAEVRQRADAVEAGVEKPPSPTR